MKRKYIYFISFCIIISIYALSYLLSFVICYEFYESKTFYQYNKVEIDGVEIQLHVIQPDHVSKRWLICPLIFSVEQSSPYVFKLALQDRDSTAVKFIVQSALLKQNVNNEINLKFLDSPNGNKEEWSEFSKIDGYWKANAYQIDRIDIFEKCSLEMTIIIEKDSELIKKRITIELIPKTNSSSGMGLIT